MPRTFNTAGPCQPAIHYMLSASGRLPNVRRVVEEQGYFVLHAPRQTGKTTALRELARELTAEGTYAAIVLSVETGATFGDDEAAMEGAVLGSWRGMITSNLPAALYPPSGLSDASPGSRIKGFLEAWARAIPRPLVVFLDEVDALQDDALISLLRQLRSGFPDRPAGFPLCIGLIGLRDVRDYLVDSGGLGSGRLGTSSPFNIKLESFRIADFSPGDIDSLLGQHTEATGQVFTREALDRCWHHGQGQPWLTNALARACVAAVRDRAIDAADMDAAAEELIRRQDTHLDSLAHKLEEPRVRAVVAPMLSGEIGTDSWPLDDLRYVEDLGLVCRPSGGGIEIANPIYRQIVARMLTESTRARLVVRYAPVWTGPDGTLDPARTLAAFLAFWRQNADMLFVTATYPEAAPHLVMMAWLDRVANGGGRVEREYAVGTGRLDLLLVVGQVKLAMELKVWRDGRPDPARLGLPQMDEYLERLGLPTGWLVVFDCRSTAKPCARRTKADQRRTPGGREVVVVRA